MTDDEKVVARPLIIGNWKMNGTRTSIANLTEGLNAISVAGHGYPALEIVVLPPAPYIAQMVVNLRGTQIKVGIQNIHTEESGAHTGEISATMAADVGCLFTLAGHSERRANQHETDIEVAHKCMIALKAGLTPVLCVGETLQERQQNKAQVVVQNQIEAVLKIAERKLLQNIVIAYEPVWAIGTGQAANSEEAGTMHSFIRTLLRTHTDRGIANQIRLIYGGSVNEHNAAGLFAQTDIDGALVGGASLAMETFAPILDCMQTAP